MPNERSSTSSAADSPSAPSRPPDPPGARRTIWTLGLGAFGLAFSITTTAAYLPPLLGGVHRSTHPDRARPRRRGPFAVDATARDRPLERHVPDPARAASALHAGRAAADGVLPRPDGIHAELLADGDARLRVLLRLLRLRAALPRPLPRPAARVGVRPGAGDPARDAGLALGGALSAVACSSTSGARSRSSSPRSCHARVRPRSCSCARRAAAVRLQGVRGYVRQLVRTAAGDGGPALPDRQHRVEGTFAAARTFVVLYIASRSRPVAQGLDRGAGGGRGRLRRRRAVSGPVGDRLGLARVISSAR